MVTACTPANWAAANLVAPAGDNSSNNYNCFIGATPTTTKGIGGSNRTSAAWTVYVSQETTTGNTITKNSNVDRGSAAFTNGGTTTFAPSTTPTWFFSNGCSGGSNVGAGVYAFWYQDANGCKSDFTPVCVTGSGSASTQVAGTINVVPTVSPASITTATTSVTVTGAAGSNISLYFNGEVIASGNIPGTYNSTTPTSGTLTFSGLTFSQNGVVSVASKIIGATINTSYCIRKSAAQVVALCTTPSPAITGNSTTGMLTAGNPIMGTGPVGATIKVYNAANTLLATTAVGVNGQWTTNGASFSNGFIGTAAAGVSYYATAQTTCSVSAASVSVTTASGVTAGRCGAITTTGISASTTAISGTLAGTAVAGTVVNI
ncbi:hypothetical protein HRG84_02875 [Flavisolibacter sp. BT320]|nr:hypothetical protein [Flavisolibacter longurius]